jgi:hypothetical protein
MINVNDAGLFSACWSGQAHWHREAFSLRLWVLVTDRQGIELLGMAMSEEADL